LTILVPFVTGGKTEASLNCRRPMISTDADELFDLTGSAKPHQLLYRRLQFVEKIGERGRNRTFNLLIKSHNSATIEMR